jgi:hypothetical protein
VWTAFIINYGASDKTTKGLRDFLWKAKKPADMKLYDFKTYVTLSTKQVPTLTPRTPWPSPWQCRHVWHHSGMCSGLEQFIHCLKHHDWKH